MKHEGISQVEMKKLIVLMSTFQGSVQVCNSVLLHLKAFFHVLLQRLGLKNATSKCSNNVI